MYRIFKNSLLHVKKNGERLLYTGSNSSIMDHPINFICRYTRSYNMSSCIQNLSCNLTTTSRTRTLQYQYILSRQNSDKLPSILIISVDTYNRYNSSHLSPLAQKTNNKNRYNSNKLKPSDLL